MAASCRPSRSWCPSTTATAASTPTPCPSCATCAGRACSTSCSAACASTARTAPPTSWPSSRPSARPQPRSCASSRVAEPAATGLTRRERLLLALIAALTVVAGVLHYAGAPGVTAFAVATGALAGMAWIVSFATEQVGERFGPAVTGVLQSTLGNLPEFFVVVFALGAGEIVVAQFSLIGSVLANALFVLGLV